MTDDLRNDVIATLKENGPMRIANITTEIPALYSHVKPVIEQLEEEGLVTTNSKGEYEYDDPNELNQWERKKMARDGTLAAALSDMLGKTDDEEMEQIILFDMYDEETGTYSSLQDLPATPLDQRFYSWSENWVYFDDGDSSYPTRPGAIPRHPPTSSSRAEKAASQVMDELRDRRGFDGWWNGIDEDIQETIREALARRIRKSYSDHE